MQGKPWLHSEFQPEQSVLQSEILPLTPKQSISHQFNCALPIIGNTERKRKTYLKHMPYTAELVSSLEERVHGGTESILAPMAH